VVIQDTIDYDTPLDFLPLGFDVDEDDHVDQPFVDTDQEEDEEHEPSPTSPPEFTIRDTFLRSDLCAFSHFTDVPETVADQDIEILHDLGMLYDRDQTPNAHADAAMVAGTIEEANAKNIPLDPVVPVHAEVFDDFAHGTCTDEDRFSLSLLILMCKIKAPHYAYMTASWSWLKVWF
jgi:hypothetical protein